MKTVRLHLSYLFGLILVGVLLVSALQLDHPTIRSAHAAAAQPGVTADGSPQVWINEVNAGTGRWIELYNGLDTAQDMAGWTLRTYADTGDNLAYTFGAFTIQPGTYVLLHDGSGEDTASDLYLNFSINWSSSLGGGAVLLNDAGTGVDMVRWGVAGFAPPSGTSWSGSALAVPAGGSTLGRAIPGGDTDSSLDWCFQPASGGGANSACSMPGEFIKTLPVNGAVDAPKEGFAVWSASSSAANYILCIDIINDNDCNTTWQEAGFSTMQAYSSLTAGTTYYWQVRARNGSNLVDADGGAWWHFTPVDEAPDAYEPDNEPAQAKEIISGVPQIRSIVPATDVDLIKFTLTSKSAISLEVAGDFYGSTRLILHDQYLNRVEQDTGSSGSTFGYIDRKCGLDALPIGDYYVKVEDNGKDNQIPAYTLKFNITEVCPHSSQTVLINEFNSGPTEWVELRNIKYNEISLTGWALQIYQGSSLAHTYTLPSFTLSSRGYVVIHEGIGVDTGADLYTGFDIDWGNNPGAAVLVNAGGVGEDAVLWNGSTITPPEGADWYSPVRIQGPPADKSMGRIPGSPDTNTQADWCNMDTSAGSNNTACLVPGAFTKIFPANGAIDPPNVLNLVWGASAYNASFEVCYYDQLQGNTCDGNWTVTGMQANRWVNIPSGRVTMWQVRATNGDKITYANSTGWWSFSTTGLAPDAYEPDNTAGQANALLAGSPQTHSLVPEGDQDWISFTLMAESAVRIQTSGDFYADTRMWLYDSSLQQVEFNDDADNYWFASIDRECGVDALPAGTYYVKVTSHIPVEQVSAYQLSLPLAWSCSAKPGAFHKTGPANGFTGVSTSMKLQWETSPGASSYEYCYYAASEGSCSSWISAGTALNADLTSLKPGVTYYWHVRANNTNGATFADNNVWWSFTIKHMLFLPVLNK